MSRNFLLVDPLEHAAVLKGLASPARIAILKQLQAKGALNVNELADLLGQPQSSVSINVQMLQEAGLIRTETVKARKGSQKICHSLYDEILIRFDDPIAKADPDAIEVAMPLGLYTGFEVSAPCGLCSSEGIIGLLDVPSTFLDPDRMKAGLIWFTRGYVEYQFPNNARLSNLAIREIEFVLELSSEVPGTSADWPSDITLTVNGLDIATWTSPGDFGDKRGAYTPDWWKLKGSQYGKLKSFRIREDGTYVDGIRLSDITLGDLDLVAHHSIRLRIGVREDARHPGGINIFGRGFGNYDQDILMRLTVR
ncbi:ArsR family transcriptional regulator [Xaviernesmea oryzae]|uniref:ArsR family transcriptional regulator n=1 Tax=Xaviernesmea oryzae TaxID=464029 RepID=A0A1Q9AR87_9HYPH|nr:helix-turn-helix domain-containing protein [Xaviernesmea oryzae]OLP57942.1 ArsR family transcriptional regulator [Xaviernesmea oryzae]SEL29824.1 Predicted transcriptional regulator [Xaviernesmea oryzae]